MSVRGYTLGIDWSRAGTFAGALEDATGYVDNGSIAVGYGRERTQAEAESGAGEMQFTLRNNGRVFSPENTSSPIAGKILPGARVTFGKMHPTPGGTIYPLIDGVLDDFEVAPELPNRTFTGKVLDAWGRPGAEKLSTPLYSGIRTGTAIGLVLDAIGWTGGRDIDTGATVMPWWWEEGSDAATAVQRIVDSEGPPAIAYVQGGVFTFRDRHHRLTRTASTTTNGTFTHINPSGTGPGGDFKVLKGTFTYDHGLRYVANTVVFSVEQRQAITEDEVWSTDTPITLGANETILVEVQASDPFVGAVNPVADTDYTMAYGTITTSLSRTSGQAALLTITAGGVAAQVNRIGIRAQPVPVVRTVKVSEEDTSSISTYGRQTWQREIPFAGVYDARAIAQRIVAVYATNRPVVSFEIAGVNDAYLTQILARKISDRITVRNDELGINRDFIIERIEHTVTKLRTEMHNVRFTCEVIEPSQAAGVLTFNVAGLGFNDGAFGINGIDNPATMFRFDVAGRGFNDGRFST